MAINPNDDWIVPAWPVPPPVRAVVTTRRGGVSRPPYASFNVGAHVGDDPAAVAANRGRLRVLLDLPAEPVWLDQVHGTHVVAADQVTAPLAADAAFTCRTGVVCAVMTADCLPLLLCNRAGTQVAAVHAGWRGLTAGVIPAALSHFDAPGADLLVWLGPAIGPAAFEVGGEVRETFLQADPANAAEFAPSPAGRWFADLYGLARRQLRTLGVTAVYGGGECTFTDAERFFSFRRDGTTGRMASLIWLQDP